MRQFLIILFAVIYCKNTDAASRIAGDIPESDKITAIPPPERTDSTVTGILSSLYEPDDQFNDDDRHANFAMLGAYRDFFSQAADFSLAMVRYRARGYESRYGEFRWNGIRIEDWWRGSTSWNLIGPLSSIPNRNISSRGITSPARLAGETVGVPGVAGTSQATTYPEELRAGGRLAWSSSNRTYTSKATAGYNVARTKSGWAVAVEASRRWGHSLSVDGMFADTWGFFASVSKHLGDNNFLGLTVLYAPSERGIQSASTAEAFALAGTNLYNPN